jgi:catechol 2,3-dioxygenase-like lactoylglutathione lyase family enzyme
MTSEPNLRQAVPFFAVSNMKQSLRFYVDGLGFEMADKWEDEGTTRWCRLVRGGTALMLQDFRRDGGKTWSPRWAIGSRALHYVHLQRRPVDLP